MTIFLLIVIAILVGLLIQQRLVRRRIVRVADDVIQSLDGELTHTKVCLQAVDLNYKALEIGQQELIDNYENDFLDLKAKNEAAYNGAAYDREMREEAEKKLKLVNDVIDQHASHCETILKDYVDAMMPEVQSEDG